MDAPIRLPNAGYAVKTSRIFLAVAIADFAAATAMAVAGAEKVDVYAVVGMGFLALVMTEVSEIVDEIRPEDPRGGDDEHS